MNFPVRPLDRVVLISLTLIALFVGLAATVPLDRLTLVLNGVFGGTMAAISLTYWRLIANAVLGIRPYDRVRQMSIGFALGWLAYSLHVGVAIYLRASGYDVATTLLVAVSRYLAIIAAVLQATAPDFGLGLFHGRDRKVLISGLLVGLLIAVLIIQLQDEQAFKSTGLLRQL